MNEITIQSHKFDEVKEKLKKISENIPSLMDLGSVPTVGGLLDLFEHKVTGEELNNLTTNTQKNLIYIKDSIIKLNEVPCQIYQFIEALDKEYIQGILISIKAVEEVSAQAKESANEARKNINELKKSIEDIKNELNNQKELTARENESNRSDINNLYKKLKILFLLAGGSVAIALISIVLNIVGVI